MVSLALKPGTSKHEHIGPSIVVIIGLEEVESTRFALQSGGLGYLHKGSIPSVLEEPQRILKSPGGNHDIEVMVVVEVVTDDSTSPVRQVEAKGGRNIGEPRKGNGGVDSLGSDES